MKNETSVIDGLVKQLRDFAGGPLVGALISVVTVPVITRLVSPTEFGKSSLFTLAQTVFSLIAFLGLDQAFVRYYNEKDIDRKKLLKNCLILPCAFCVLLIVVILVFHKSLSVFLFGQNEPTIMVALCFLLPSLVINRFAMLLIRMDLRGKLYSLLNVVTQVVGFSVLLFFLIVYEKSFRSIVFATIISSLINTMLSVVVTRNYWDVSLGLVDKDLLYTLLSFGLPLVPATLLSWLLNSFDKIGLRSWSSFEELGLYAAAFKVVSILSIIQSVFTTTWIPVAYEWHEKNTETKEFDRVSSVVLSCMSLAFACVIVFRNVILMLLGPEYRNTSSTFVFLLFVPVLYTVSETTTLGIAFSKKTVYNLYVSIITAVFNLIGNYALIPKLGAQGAAFTTCVSYIVFFWTRTLFSRKQWYKFGLQKYIIDIFALFILAIISSRDSYRFFEVILVVFIIIYNSFLCYKTLRKL